MSNIGVAIQQSVGIHAWSAACSQKSTSTKSMQQMHTPMSFQVPR